MRNVFTAAVLVAGMLGLVPAIDAQPHYVHQDHFLTFDTPVSLPGGVILPPGTYLFKFMIPSQPGVVQVFSADRSTLYAALSTIPVRRNTATGYQVTFSETSGNTPRQVKAWFCDGKGAGHQFVDQTESRTKR